METMHYSEKKTSSKGFVIAFLLFVLIGGSIIYYAISSEEQPVVIGSQESDIQRLVELEKEDETKITAQNESITYEVKDITKSDTTDKNIKADMTLPSISIESEEVVELNEEIKSKYYELFDKLKEKMSSAESKYTYIVSYNVYENMIGTKKVVSITVYQRVRDDSAKKNTTEKVDTYNIDLSTKEVISQFDVAKELLGKDYKTIIKTSIEDYVVDKGMLKESEFTYAITGLESYYVKEGAFHIIFDEGKLVDTKYGMLDIEVKTLKEE